MKLFWIHKCDMHDVFFLVFEFGRWCGSSFICPFMCPIFLHLILHEECYSNIETPPTH